MNNIEIHSLYNISNKLYELINNENHEPNDINILKQMITKYYENINNNNKILEEKELYYNTHINNPRIVQNELYETYLNEREELYNSWLVNKNIESMRKLSSFNKFDYKHIPNIFTYDIHINENFGKKLKPENNDKTKKDKKVEKDKEDFSEIEEDNNDDITHENDMKKTNIENKPNEVNNCTDKKNKECDKKGKVCNPVTGRCVIPKNIDKSTLNKPLQEDFEIKEDKPQDNIPPSDDKSKKVNNCTDKKIKECQEKGKVCNPVSGRCVIPKNIDKSTVNKPVQENFEIEEDEIQDNIPTDDKSKKVNNCSDKKIKECDEKGKKCNPITGRCIKK